MVKRTIVVVTGAAWMGMAALVTAAQAPAPSPSPAPPGAARPAAPPPQNLQVLPKDTPRPELIRIMRSFASALGVRCIHCHVGQDTGDLKDMDFPNDAKPQKKVAREMLRMTQAINQQYIAALNRPNPVRVQCVTCHRGVTRPTTLETELTGAYEQRGVEGAVARYRELREQYHGRAAYDFGPGTLNMMAEQRMATKPAEAVALLALNLEFHPDAAHTHFLMGEAHRATGDMEKARAEYERVLALDPANAQAKRRLEEMKAPAPAASPSPTN
ncbi:MAG TPA: c-type cytochrome [Vicinamibacteria bacterium]|nr:c-type cytochrome [Vicinamibacteria bacterium]